MRMTKNWTVFKRVSGGKNTFAFVSASGLVELMRADGSDIDIFNPASRWIGKHISELTPSNGWTKINVQKMSQANLAKGILE